MYPMITNASRVDIRYVQEVVTILYNNLQYKMVRYLLDRLYNHSSHFTVRRIFIRFPVVSNYLSLRGAVRILLY